MNKYKVEISKHQLDSITFVKSLEELSEKEWRTEIEEGKWTIAEIIGHFKPWDEFIIHKRLPYLFSKDELPKGPDSKKMNLDSAAISRRENQLTTIENFISTRNELYKKINEIPDEYWVKNFTIGETTLSLYEYLKGLAQHDCHHFRQIKNTHLFLKERER
ncbi:DinB family protein [Alteribacter keqinensis]|uniref:DinB family protein n=1 Tax=Alteribacter keqinensis TaxID=2483800 RepID=UPI0016058CA8|nr:DinB family protein [Alteribacter keqinensis]